MSLSVSAKTPPTTRSTLFPYTTLFRSLCQLGACQRLRLLHVRLIERVHTQADAQLPRRVFPRDERLAQSERVGREVRDDLAIGTSDSDGLVDHGRSEERRGGKEGRCRWRRS